MRSSEKGVVATGHDETARVAEDIIKSGGNAFDAVVAAHLAACVTEPVLSSLAGGGFLLARTPNHSCTLYDFFVQTPLRHRNPQEVEFYPISADFGETQQEFHIGMGSFATPGTVKGLFEIHSDLCTMPFRRLAEPAVELARKGVRLNHFQAYILDIVKPIFLASEEALRIYGHPGKKETLLKEGGMLYQPDFADFLETLAIEGEALFYQGEIAQMVDQMSRKSGGFVTADDFAKYQVKKRNPLRVMYHDDTEMMVNPAPSSGGTLIAFALKLMEEIGLSAFSFGSPAHLMALARVQELTDIARIDFLTKHKKPYPGEEMMDPSYIASFREQASETARFVRGTTHISIIDKEGNAASLTATNGEGCGNIIPGTGTMLNNMLGEEDLHPDGFHRWPENRRISSMMAPAILTQKEGSVIALGSGGSNRIRTAILQVILNLCDFNLSLEEAVNNPRVHCEKALLSVERGFDPAALAPLLNAWPNHKIWRGMNLYFGGTHAVKKSPDGFEGAGDPRRGGVAQIIH